MNSSQNKRNTAWGIFLIVLGLAAMLDFLPINSAQADWYQVYILAGGGLIGMAVYLLNRNDGLLALPGYIQLVLAITGALAMSGDPDNRVLPVIIVALVALPFWVSFLTNRSARWWAAIPGYILLFPLPIILLEGQIYTEELTATYILAAFSAPFFYIFFANRPHHKWAIYPAGISALMAFIFLLDSSFGYYLVPIMLILAGVWVWRYQGNDGDQALRSA